VRAPVMPKGCDRIEPPLTLYFSDPMPASRGIEALAGESFVELPDVDVVDLGHALTASTA